MRFSALALCSLIPALALAAQINVTVGDQGQLQYNPSSVTANVGDVIVFQFEAKNHTVTQSTFADPCTHAVNPSTGQQGVDSGFMPVTQGATLPTFAIQVSTTSPLWFYCRQTGHCQKGMVFAVNPTAAKSFAAFQAAAMSSTPGSTTPPTGSTTPPTGSTTPPTGSTNPNPPVAGQPGDTSILTTSTTPAFGTTQGPIGTQTPVGSPLTTSSSTTPSPTSTASGAESLSVGRGLVVVMALAAGLLL